MPSASVRKIEPRVLAGKYALGEVLGSGTMGTVYAAENLLVGRPAAIKLMNSALASDPEQRNVFLAEARTIARVGHPNVVEVFDVGFDRDGVPFIVMELLEGQTLEEILIERGPLPMPYACELIAQVLAAVGAAHRAGVFHRDLKPANVIVTHPEPDRPLVKVLDFGIAEGLVDREWLGCAGTPLYMAPEQALARPVDERADLYSVAAMLYEVLSGEPPYLFSTPAEILRASLANRCARVDALVPGVPPALGDAIHRALSADPAARPASAAELFEQVALYADGTRVSRVRPVSLCSLPIPLVEREAMAIDFIPPAPRTPSIDLEPPVADDVSEDEPALPVRRAWPAVLLAVLGGFSIGAAACWWFW